MGKFRFNIDEYNKRLKEIDRKYKDAEIKISAFYDKISEEKTNLLKSYLDLEGKYLKLCEDSYMLVEGVTLREGRQPRNGRIELFGLYFYVDICPYFYESSAKWKPYTDINLELDDLNKIEEVTKEEFLDAFNKSLDRLRDVQEQAISEVFQRIEYNKN